MILRFVVTRVASPWNHKTNKKLHCSTRVAVRCERIEYDPPQPEFPEISTSIFVYRWDNHKYRFDHVATPTDLMELPMLSEVENDEPKPTWCRSDSVDLILPEYTIGEQFIKDLYSDIYFLGSEIGAYKAIVGPVTETIEVDIENSTGG